MKDQLPAHNARCREWADKQPPKYRKALLAFAYRADTETLSFSMTFDEISKLSRRYGYGVSVRSLKDHAKVFEDHGLIKIERRWKLDKRDASVYTMNMNAVIGEPKANEPAIHGGSMPRSVRKAGRSSDNCNALEADYCDNCAELFGYEWGTSAPLEAITFHNSQAYLRHRSDRSRR